MAERDDFTAKTKEILAQRVTFLCSNPDCRAVTSGPHTEPDKVTKLGVAAHITAASPGGPRYDATISQGERANIDNGIWLCVNCSVLIDKDPDGYPVGLLTDWKIGAEQESRDKLGKPQAASAGIVPHIECDLIWASSGRGFHGPSPANFKQGEERILTAGQDFIAFYTLKWQFILSIYNNAPVNAYNLSIAQVAGMEIDRSISLPQVNNLPSLGNIDVELFFSEPFEGYSKDADAILKPKIPDQLNGARFELTYADDARNEHKTLLSIEGNQFVSAKV